MKIFLSYATEDRALAEEVQLALIGAGHDVFFDRQSLPAGGDYHARIKASVDAADLFVFLISNDSVAAGGYALTEMGYARSRWPHPKERVLPVLVRPTPFADIPAYLKSVTVLEPGGNTAAEVVTAVTRIAAAPAAAASAAASAPAPPAPSGGGMKLLLGAGAALLGLAVVVYYVSKGSSDPELAKPAKLVEAVSSERVPNPLELRFSYSGGAAGTVELDPTLRVSLEAGRRIINAKRLARQDDGHYSQEAPYPTENEIIRGVLTRDVASSSQGDTAAPAQFCLKRPSPLPDFDDKYVHLDCKADSACQLHVPSPHWLELCPAEARKITRALGFFGVAHAAVGERRWAVPSAETLAAHKDELKGVGYTLFTVETDALQDPALIGVEVDVHVNGTPVLEDGLAAPLRPVPYDPSRPFRHVFALQSLDFEGAQGGCEAIVLTLRGRAAGGTRSEPLSATLPYVALRDASVQTLTLGKGRLSWSAKYVVPEDEWSHEAFITSVTYSTTGGETAATAARQRAEALKREFDRLGIRHQGKPVVAVIRPPLTQTGQTLAYGLTSGVVQPSGQVRFTFSSAEANAIGDLLFASRGSPAARRVINPEKYIYKVAGTSQRRETPTPPGLCKHV